MGLIRPIAPSFGGGEYSPFLYSRVDLDRYKIGLKTCRNFIIHPHGGASNRPGFQYVAGAKHSLTMNVAVQEFIFSETQAYILEFGHEYVRFFTNGQRITSSPGVIYEVSTPYDEDDVLDLKFESSADVIWITHPDYQPRTLSRLANANWLLETYEPDDGPFMAENIDESISMNVSAVTGAGVSLTVSSAYFNSGHVDALFKLIHYIEGQTISTSFTSATTSSSIKCFTTWRVISHGTWTGKFRVEKSDDGGTSWTVLRTFSSTDDFNANTSGTEDIETNEVPFLVRINMYSYTSGTANIDLTTDPFYQEGIVRGTTYNTTTKMTVEVLQDAGLTTNTTAWAEGSWSDSAGWPRVSRFYKDRLCFAATDTEPQTLWLTEVGNYYSFVRHSSLLDTDGITVNLPSRQINFINGLISLTRLIVLTNSSEWSVGPGPSGVLTPTSIDQRVEGYRGSNGVTPTVVGNEAVYVQTNGKVIRNIGYEFGSDSFTGSDMNILARHLFDRWTISDIAYQQDPDSIVWCLRSDGRLLGMTYMKEQEVVAWHQHFTGFGYDSNGNKIGSMDTIESIAIIPNSSANFDELYAVISRTNGRFIERMALRMEGQLCGDENRRLIEHQKFLDSVTSNTSYLSIESIIEGSSVTTIISTAHGLSEGQTIRIAAITGYPAYRGKKYTITNVSTDSFDLDEEV